MGPIITQLASRGVSLTRGHLVLLSILVSEELSLKRAESLCIMEEKNLQWWRLRRLGKDKKTRRQRHLSFKLWNHAVRPQTLGICFKSANVWRQLISCKQMKRDVQLSCWYGTEETQSKGNLDNIRIQKVMEFWGWLFLVSRNWERSFWKQFHLAWREGSSWHPVDTLT